MIISFHFSSFSQALFTSGATAVDWEYVRKLVVQGIKKAATTISSIQPEWLKCRVYRTPKNVSLRGYSATMPNSTMNMTQSDVSQLQLKCALCHTDAPEVGI